LQQLTHHPLNVSLSASQVLKKTYTVSPDLLDEKSPTLTGHASSGEEENSTKGLSLRTTCFVIMSITHKYHCIALQLIRNRLEAIYELVRGGDEEEAEEQERQEQGPSAHYSARGAQAELLPLLLGTH
jgi:hypothetical protein